MPEDTKQAPEAFQLQNPHNVCCGHRQTAQDVISKHITCLEARIHRLKELGAMLPAKPTPQQDEAVIRLLLETHN